MAKLIEDTIGKDDFQLRVVYRTQKTQSFYHKQKCRKNSNQTYIIYYYDCDQDTDTSVHLPKDSNFSIITRTQHTLTAESLSNVNYGHQFKDV